MKKLILSLTLIALLTASLGGVAFAQSPAGAASRGDHRDGPGERSRPGGRLSGPCILPSTPW